MAETYHEEALVGIVFASKDFALLLEITKQSNRNYLEFQKCLQHFHRYVLLINIIKFYMLSKKNSYVDVVIMIYAIVRIATLLCLVGCKLCAVFHTMFYNKIEHGIFNLLIFRSQYHSDIFSYLLLHIVRLQYSMHEVVIIYYMKNGERLGSIIAYYVTAVVLKIHNIIIKLPSHTAVFFINYSCDKCSFNFLQHACFVFFSYINKSGVIAKITKVKIQL